MAITPLGYSHVRLTVSDIEVSRRFYDAVFALPVAIDLPPDADEAARGEPRLPVRRGDLPARPTACSACDRSRTRTTGSTRTGSGSIICPSPSPDRIWTRRSSRSTRWASNTARSRTSGPVASWNSAIRTASRSNCSPPIAEADAATGDQPAASKFSSSAARNSSGLLEERRMPGIGNDHLPVACRRRRRNRPARAGSARPSAAAGRPRRPASRG